MDDEEHEAYNNLRDVVKDLNAKGHRLQDILDDCYKFSQHYVSKTPEEEYNRTYELNYITRTIATTYEGKKIE